MELQWLGFILANLIAQQTSHALEVTGARGGVDSSSGARPFRYEISSFSQSGPPWDLFVLSLLELQSVNLSDPLSYFAIAGTFTMIIDYYIANQNT
jgi:hypothetical protein